MKKSSFIQNSGICRKLNSEIAVHNDLKHKSIIINQLEIFLEEILHGLAVFNYSHPFTIHINNARL